MTEKKVRKCKPPYCCIRCGYSTSQKPDIKKHFYDLKKVCPAIENDIELTDYIKNYIMNNRIFKIPEIIKKEFKTTKLEVQNIYEYIYLVWCKENAKHGEDVYKFGKSKTSEKVINIARIASYGKGSQILLVIECKNANVLEQKISGQFKKEFVKHDFGNEYFVGNKKRMMQIIMETVNEEIEAYELVSKTESLNLLTDEKNINSYDSSNIKYKLD